MKKKIKKSDEENSLLLTQLCMHNACVRKYEMHAYNKITLIRNYLNIKRMNEKIWDV